VSTADQIVTIFAEKKWIPDQYNNAPTTFNFIQSKAVDSVQVVQLVVELEALFDIQFEADDFTSQDFETISGLARIVDLRRK